MKDGRHFTDLTEQGLEKLIAPLSDITLISSWTTLDKRPDRDEMWLNALLQKSPNPPFCEAPYFPMLYTSCSTPH